ncbi:MAG: hypothetical protein KDD47_15825 [Acidobacteria bacterium]|nr:hypothetical protein [Acidobacteriota bacterium]
MSQLLALLAAIGGLALAGLGVFWVGFQTVPAAYPDVSSPESPLVPAEPGEPSAGARFLPVELPAYLAEHFREVFGASSTSFTPPKISTAVIWGRGRYRFYGFMVPMRFRGFYRPGESFFRTIDLTWFGRGVLRIRESFSEGVGRRSFEGWVKGEGKGGDLDPNLQQALWREAFWAPTVLFEVPWEKVSEDRFRCPAAPFEARRHPKTGRLVSLEGELPSRADGTVPRWQAALRAWQRFHGIEIPTQVWICQRGSREAETLFVVQGVAYNLELPNDLQQAPRHLEGTREKTS